MTPFNMEPPAMRILDAIVSAALVVAMAIASWALTSTIDLRERVAVIESTAATNSHLEETEATLRAEFLRGITDIKRCLNQIQRDKTCDL